MFYPWASSADHFRLARRGLEKAVRDIYEMGTLKVRVHSYSGEIRVTSRKFRVTAREVLQAGVEASVGVLPPGVCRGSLPRRRCGGS